MKLVTRSQRLLAILMGVVVLIAIVNQILRDDRRLESKKVKVLQSITK